MAQRILPPRYNGTVFNVFYSTDPASKVTAKGHVITSPDSFEVISADWRQSVYKLPVSDIVSIEAKKMVVTVTLRPGAPFPLITLNTKPEPCESLVTALTPLSGLPKKELNFLSMAAILPTFRFPDKSALATLHRLACEQTVHLVQALQPAAQAASVSAPLTDIFECAYRMRWVNQASARIDRSVRELSQDIIRHLLIAWCYCVIHAAQPIQTPVARVYFSRLSLHCGRTVVKAANAVGIPAQDLMPLVEAYAADGPPDGIEAVALRVARAAQDAMDQGLTEDPACDLKNLRLLLNCAVIGLSAVLSGIYDVDLESFSAKVVEYTRAVVSNSNVERMKKTLVKVQQAFLREMLYFLDGQRYDEPFQYVFCTWPYGGFDEA
jgi:hypothetical protein